MSNNASIETYNRFMKRWLPENSLEKNNTGIQKKKAKKPPTSYCSTQKKDYQYWPELIESVSEKREIAGRSWDKNQDHSSRLITDSYLETCIPTLTSVYDLNMNRKVDRLEAGSDKGFSLFRRPIPPSGLPYYWRPEPPTNWGLLEEKQKEWNWKPNLKTEESVYQQDFRWPGLVTVDEEKEAALRVEKHGVSTKLASHLIPSNLTVKDWHLRGKKCQMLPISWKPPQPRMPSKLARTSVAYPEEDRCKEIGKRFAVHKSEPLHPVEKWAANLFLA